MEDLDNKVDIWEHRNLQEQVWELEQKLEKLYKEFIELRESLKSDGK